MIWDWSYAIESLPVLWHGLQVTVAVTALASLLAAGLGLVLAILRVTGISLVAVPVRLLVDFVRGTPMLVQLFFWFYGMPGLGLRMSAFQTGVVAMGIHFAAYMSEVYRAGISSVPRGHIEASETLGLPPLWKWVDVIIPHTVRTVLPALGNYVILMFKYSPILAAITVRELLANAIELGDRTYRFVEPLTLVGVLFILVSLATALLLRRAESRMETPA